MLFIKNKSNGAIITEVKVGNAIQPVQVPPLKVLGIDNAKTIASEERRYAKFLEFTTTYDGEFLTFGSEVENTDAKNETTDTTVATTPTVNQDPSPVNSEDPIITPIVNQDLEPSNDGNSSEDGFSELKESLLLKINESGLHNATIRSLTNHAEKAETLDELKAVYDQLQSKLQES